MKKVHLLLFTLILLMISRNVSAYDFEVNGIGYDETSTSTVSVTHDDTYFGNIVIPSSVILNGTTYSITSIKFDAFNGCSKLTSITIPNSVTSIGESAFNG